MKYVIIGNSAAGIGGVEGIRQHDKHGEITIISNEPYHTYSRPLISYFLLGKTNEEKMKYRANNFYENNNARLLHADATEIDTLQKHVVVADGRRIPYDKLLVATGSSPFVPPFEGLDSVTNKVTFMSLDDAKKLDAMLSADDDNLSDDKSSPSNNLSSDKSSSEKLSSDKTCRTKNVLIIGAGLIGLKCAEGIVGKAKSVTVVGRTKAPNKTSASNAPNITVVDLAPRVLSSILDDDGAEVVRKHLEHNGVKFKLSTTIKRFDKNIAVLDNDETVEFDILVLAVGVRPNTALLKDVAKVERGIVVNEKSETTAQNIYAAGDCTQTVDVSCCEEKVMALLPNAYMQGECAGVNMAGGARAFDKAIPMNAIGFFGLHIVTAGNYIGDVYSENDGANYKRLFYGGNKLNGYILIGNVENAGIYTSLVRERTPLDSIDFALVCERPGLMAFTKADRVKKLGESA